MKLYIRGKSHSNVYVNSSKTETIVILKYVKTYIYIDVQRFVEF